MFLEDKADATTIVADFICTIHIYIFTIFNRTHYENVLITRVHPEYLENERNPYIDINNLTDDFWNNRMQRMFQFEKFWAENGVIILKFYLHLSKDEQKLPTINALKDKLKTTLK